MTWRGEILKRFRGEGSGSLLFLPDLTAWYEWHSARETLPEPWRGMALPQVATALGAPTFAVARPWTRTFSGSQIESAETADERVRRIVTPKGVLQARWSLGPDGDWWQVEYPAKTVDDLAAALEALSGRAYRLDPGAFGEVRSQVGDAGVVAIELPRQPYSELLHEWIGWSEGLMLLMDAADLVEQALAAMADQVRTLVTALGEVEADLALSPDNLDGQYISPRAFEAHMASDYRATAEQLRAQGKPLVVHAGGPVGRLLPGLAAAGVHGIEGICGPPQGDLGLAQARQLAGAELVLWGGVPQDVLLPSASHEAFAAAVRKAATEAARDPHALIGVADKVPVDADPARLAQISELIASS